MALYAFIHGHFSKKLKLAPPHWKPVYTDVCLVQMLFDDPSAASLVCISATVSSQLRACHLAFPYRSGLPCACLCFPNHSCTGNQTPAFRGKQKPSLSFSTTWSCLKVWASFSCSCQCRPQKCPVGKFRPEVLFSIEGVSSKVVLRHGTCCVSTGG